MIIKGLSRAQILEAVEKTNEEWGGNLELEDRSWAVKLPTPEYDITISKFYDSGRYEDSHDYHPEGWYVQYRENADYYSKKWDIPVTPGRWTTLGEPYKTREGAILAGFELAQKPLMWSYQDPESYEYTDIYQGEHARISIHKRGVKYEYGPVKPLNKKDDRHNIKLRVKSSRKPGARVSPQMHFFGAGNPRRVNAACWHLNRDFYREIFKINPDAKISTVLATYNGEDDFEENHYYAGSNSGSMMFPTHMADNCNCDEGEYPEFATEGLTEEQYELREWIWKDCEYSNVKTPKKEVAVTR